MTFRVKRKTETKLFERVFEASSSEISDACATFRIELICGIVLASEFDGVMHKYILHSVLDQKGFDLELPVSHYPTYR